MPIPFAKDNQPTVPTVVTVPAGLGRLGGLEETYPLVARTIATLPALVASFSFGLTSMIDRRSGRSVHEACRIHLRRAYSPGNRAVVHFPLVYFPII